MTPREISQTEKDKTTISLTCEMGCNAERDKADKLADNSTGLAKGARVGERTKRVQGVRYMATGGEWTWGGDRTMRYTEEVF